MAVATQYSPKRYKPGAAMAAEPIGWQFLSPVDVRVTHVADATGVATVLAAGTGYALAGNGPAGTATVRALEAWPADDLFLVERVTTIAQDARWVPHEPAPAADTERQLDRQTLVQQESRAQAIDLDRRALMAKPGQVFADIDKPSFAGKFFGGSATGDPVPLSGTGADAALREDLADPLAAGALVARRRAGVGAITRTIQQVLDDLPVHVRDYGAVGDGITDDTDAIRAAINAAALGNRSIAFSANTYKITRTVSIPLGFTIYSDGAVLDATEDFDTNDGLDLNALYIGSDAYWELPKLASDETAGDTLVSFVGAHGLKPGDIWCIYNPVDSSFAYIPTPEDPEVTTRGYYREGEFCEVVRDTAINQVLLANGLAVGHAAATVECYKMDTGTFSLVGSLRVRIAQPTPDDATTAIFIQQVVKSNITGLRAEAIGGAYAAIVQHRCYRLHIDYEAEQHSPSVDNDGYGLIVANCQRCTTRGNAFSARHALAHGGYDGPCNVPNRDISHFGTWSTTGEGGVPAVDVHGNAEDIKLRGTADGGITCGGKSIDARHCVIKAHPQFGFAIQLGEVVRFDYDFSGARIIGNSVDPADVDRATVDIGSNGTFEANNLESGTLRLVSATIDALKSTRGIIAIKRNGVELEGARHSIDARGAIINVDPTSGIPIYCEIAGAATQNWDTIDVRDTVLNGGANSIIIEADTVRAPEQKGSATINVTTAAASVGIEVLFPKPFPVGYHPAVDVNLRGSVTNGAFLSLQVHNVTNTAFFATLRTVDGTTFAADRADVFDWVAK